MIKLAQDTLATISKDLQLAAYLTEALLQTERFAGLRQGLDLTYRLLTEFWDTVYPVIEDGDRELRARPLAWIGTMLDFPLRSQPLVVGRLLVHRRTRNRGSWATRTRSRPTRIARRAPR